jgi:tight adherence protein C
VLLVLLFAAVAIGVLVVAQILTAPARQRRLSLDRVQAYGGAVGVRARARTVQSGPLSGRLGRALARTSVRFTPGRSTDAVAARLVAAGFADRVSPTGFLAAKIVFGVGGVVLGAALGALGNAAGAFFLALTFGVFGFIGPEMVVGRRAKARLERIQADMPNALDILAIGVEGGASFDGAMALLIEHLEGPLADELAFTFNELRIGESRAEALRKLADRADVPEMTSFTSAVIQGERLGISLSRVLRSLAGETRRRRQGDAEERANKMAVRMVFPIALFIMPALFIVMIGPALISLLHTI